MTPIAVPDDVMRLITEAIAGIQDGLADVEAGRVRPWERFEAEFVARHQIKPAVESSRDKNSELP